MNTALSLLAALLLELALLAALLAWGDSGTRHAATIIGIGLGCALALWLVSLVAYTASQRRA